MVDTDAVAAAALSQTRAEELEQSEEHWRAMFEHAPVAMLIADDERRFVDANVAACELLGAPREQIIGAPLKEFVLPPYPSRPVNAGLRWAAFLSSGHEAGECIILRPDGSKRYADFHARANFHPGLHLCIAHDGTERKVTEEVVRRAESSYRSLVETTNTGYLVTDQDGRVLDANAEYVRLTGAGDLAAIRGRDVLQWTHPDDRERHAAGIAECVCEGAVRDLQVRFGGAAGNMVPVEINATAVHSDAGVRLLSLCRDITSREAARQEVETAWHELETRVQQRTAQLAHANEQIRIRARQQEAVAEFGRRALAGENFTHLLHQAGDMVAHLLEVEFTCVLEHADAQSKHLLLRACRGLDRSLGEPIATTNPALLPGYVMRLGKSVVIDDLRREDRFQLPPGMLGFGIISGITVLIPGEERPFGIIGALTKQARKFTQDDLHFVQSVANVLAAAMERTRAEEIVRQAREAAVKANDAKLEFLSRMSHELRTPLNAILGFGQLLEIEELGARQQESVDQIISAGRHLLHLVNEVLDISRIESGHFSFALEPLAVTDLLSEAIDLMRPLAAAEDIAITILPEGLAGHPHVLADHQRVRQVLINLLSNAVKYNRHGGQVRVSARPAPDGRSMRVQVADTGLGIAVEHLPRLFTPFDRLGAENTRVEGSGIGLALSRRLMEAQGGCLGVESVVGEGSTFWIDLPMAAAPAPDCPHPRFDESTGPLSLEPAPAELLARQTVLHIEDNEQNRRLMELLLSQRPSLRLVAAGRGDQGLELARLHCPNLILLDMHLPDTSGEQVLRILRADSLTKDTPVVVVSADATAVRQASLRALGANEYLTKPFNVKEFLHIIDEHLQLAHAGVPSPGAGCSGGL
jgi:PAS domain S-box-containing protein